MGVSKWLSQDDIDVILDLGKGLGVLQELSAALPDGQDNSLGKTIAGFNSILNLLTPIHQRMVAQAVDIENEQRGHVSPMRLGATSHLTLVKNPAKVSGSKRKGAA